MNDSNYTEKTFFRPNNQTDHSLGNKSILIPQANLFKINNLGENKSKESGNKKLRLGKKVKIILPILLVSLSFFLIIGFLLFKFYKSSLVVEESVKKVIKAFQNKNLVEVKKELITTKDKLDELEKTFNKISFTIFFPFVGKYVDDAGHLINAGKEAVDASFILISAVEPYSNIIGFKTDQEQDLGGKTAQDKLDFVIQTIPNIIPKADELIAKVSSIDEEISYIDYKDYPKEFAGKKVQERIKHVVELLDSSRNLVENSKPFLEKIPYFMGVDEERKYLILFQNDKELRPTGGFITAYSIANVFKGRFEPVLSDDIYNLDDLYKPKVKAPDPIVKYLKGPYTLTRNYRLRDMNWSPDFEEAMRLFLNEIESVGIKGIDGVIAVDTQLLVYFLDVTGPINVPSYGEFSTQIIPECNCPQVIHELESFADIEGPIVWSENEPGKIVYAPPNYDNRKKIIGPLMNSVLSVILGQPEEKFPALFEAAFKSLVEKHVLFYMVDDKVQKAVSDFGIAGKLKNWNGDYLHISDANLGGRKSNLYVTQEVDQQVVIGKDGSVEKILTITYKNSEKQDGWLNSILPNWVRIYVPKGSILIDASGFEEEAEPYEDLGRTVFAGFFRLRPLGVSRITVKYKLPFSVDKNYSLLIQKQPGTDAPLYSLKVGKNEQEFLLKTDKEFTFSI